MNLVTDLEDALRMAGLMCTTTYNADDDYFPTVHVGGWMVGVDGSCLNVGLGPYVVTHPEEEQDGAGKHPQQSPMLMTPEDVVRYLTEHGAGRPRLRLV